MHDLCTESRSTNDEGATLVFIAVVLVALLALTAFAVDFGRMWEERRQLQNGADAAALAIAEDCVRGLCDAAYDEYAVADAYADENARDGFAEAWLVDLDLTAQTVTVHNRTEDPGGDHKFDMLFAGAVGFDGFTVGAKATVAWGALASPAETIPLIISECEWERAYWEGGAGGKNPAPIDPNEATAWHLFEEPKPSEDVPILPWTAPFPDWWTSYPSGPPDPPLGEWSAPAFIDIDNEGADPEETTGDGQDDTIVPSPLLDLGVVPGPVPVVLYFHDGPGDPTCDAGPSGADLPGGFGWLEVDQDAPLPCVSDVFKGVVSGDPGGNGNPPKGCKGDDIRDLLLGEDGEGALVFIPFYDEKTGTGNNIEYHVSGYGGFWVVGYNFGSGQYQDYAPPLTDDPCRPGQGHIQPLGKDNTAANRCLVGYFVEAVYTGGGDIGPGGHGLTTFKLTD